MARGLIALVVLLSGCRSQGGALDPAQDLPQAQNPPPPLELTILYDDPRSELGWGNLALSARPMEHEIRVDMMVGAPVRTPRWRYCGAGELSIDGRRTILPLQYSGVPMQSGIYDAVTVDITIEDVRAMSRADDVSVTVCGDRVALRREQLLDLGGFVRRFEEMATYDGPPAPMRPHTLDWEPEVPSGNERPTES